MALTHLTPEPARVRWDRRANRPADVRLGGRRLTVTGLAARRDELAAYRPEIGPRITYLLDTDAGRATLVFDGVRRRWFLEELDAAA